MLTSIFAIVAAVGTARVVDAANCSFDTIKPSGQLDWCSCGPNSYCAKLKVPLNYQNANLGYASLPLIKYAAQSNSTDGAYQGMLLINPGGPGVSGVSVVQSNGAALQMVIGTNWDIVGFDPRGLSLSEPSINCSSGVDASASTSEFQLQTDYPSGDGVYRQSNSSVPRLTEQYYTSFEGYYHALGKECNALDGGDRDAGPHMSTSVVARDMLSIVDAYTRTSDSKKAAKPSHLLHYYGISYGTFLGQTFASMFPDRVGNMVLDGVVSPAEVQLTSVTNHPLHVDAVLASFFIYCHEAGPASCPYYTGSTPKDIFERFRRSFVQLDARHAAAQHLPNAFDIETALLILKTAMDSSVSVPNSQFSSLTEILLDLESALAAGDLKPWITNVSAVVGNPGPPVPGSPENQAGILCTDANGRLYGKTLKDIQPSIRALEAVSIIGELYIMPVLACMGWPIRGQEIFTGPYGGNTATPILFISNTYDPATPIENAFAVAPHYKNAQILTVDAIGHTLALNQNSCGLAKLQAYFQTTALPGNSSFCPLEAGPYGVTLQGTLKENIAKAGLTRLQ